MANLYPQYVSALGAGITNPVGPLHVQVNGSSNALVVATNACVGVGKSNALFPLDVLGDINFTGSLRSNGQIYAPLASQFTTNSGSNIYLASGSNLALGGRSNALYTLDVLGDINFTGTLRSNGIPMIPANGAVTISPAYVELLTNNNTLAMTSTNHTYTSSTFTSLAGAASTAVISYNGGGWVPGGGLFAVTATINGVSRTTEVYNSGVSHMPVPGLQFAVQLAANRAYTVTLTFSNNALTDANDYHNLNVTMFPNTVAVTGVVTCQALWYSASNVPAGNYVGTTAFGGIALQNNSTIGTDAFNTTTGLFTCQYPGTYQCNFTSTTFVAQDSVQIYRNGAIISPGYQCYGNVNNSIALSACIYCSAGDTLGFYVATGTIMGGGDGGTQGCSIALMSSGSPGQLYFGGSNSLYLAAGSNLGLGGKSNPAYPLDVAGDINFTGILRSNGIPYVGSQWTTSNASTLIYGSNVYIGGNLTVNGSNLVINNAGTGPALQVTQSQTSPNQVASFMAGSNMALYINSNAYVGIGNSNPAYALDVTGNIRSTNLPRYWNSVRLYGPSPPSAKTYFLLGTLGDYGHPSNGGANISITGTLGSFGGIKAQINVSLNSRNATATTVNTIGTMTSSGTLASLLQFCDIYVYYQGGGGTATTPQYYVYLVTGMTGNFVSFDLNVTGNDTTSYSVCLSEPAQGTTTTPTGTLLSGTPSVLSALQEYNMNGNVGIGKSNPAYALDVTGSINFSGSILQNGAPMGSGQFTTVSSSNVYLPSGSNLGIGNSNPAYAIDVVGDINCSGAVRVRGNPVLGTQYMPVTKLQTGAMAQITFLIQSNSTVHACGDNYFGQLGNNTTNSSSIPIIISSFGSLFGRTITTVSGGVQFTMALDSTGSVHTWGRCDTGQLGNNTQINSSIPILISSYGTLSGKRIVAIAAGNAHALALDNTGAVHTWGYNGSGQLGNNTTTDSLLPIAISSISGSSLIGKTITAIACGETHSFAIDSTGAVHTWGNNTYGSLGFYTAYERPYKIPTNISSLSGSSLINKTIIAIGGGGNHSIALDSTGVVHTWGSNSYGQLGKNITPDAEYNIYTPIAISTISGSSLVGKNIIAIASGQNHNVALDSNGTVHCWGADGNGQLGDNIVNPAWNSYKSLPLAVSYGSLVGKKIIAIAAGSGHSIALDSMGVVHTWGINGSGQLGNNTTTKSVIPISISTFGSLATLSTVFTNFTGQHRCFLSDIAESSQQNYQGLIACATKNKYSDVQIGNGPNNSYVISSVTSGADAITINESLPVVSLCAKANDKSCFGVISMSKDNASTEDQIAIANLRNSQGDSRVEINALGEGAIWVSDANGPLESGDYITTSSITGYGQRQADDLLHNYTVAKITMDCDFNPTQVPKMQVKRDISGGIITYDNGAMVWEPVTIDPAQESYQQALNSWHSQPGQDPSTMPQYSPSPPEQWIQVMTPAYQIRYLAADGSQITQELYNTAKAADSNAPVYKAAFVGCTYHCG